MLWGVLLTCGFYETARFLRPRLIQHLADFVRERGGREGFLQQRHAFVQHALVHDGILGVGEGEQDFRVRIQRPHAVGQLENSATRWASQFRKCFLSGDALFPGGNDYPAKEAGVVSIQVRDPDETKRVIEAIIACFGLVN
jgi:hypothetical protein